MEETHGLLRVVSFNNRVARFFWEDTGSMGQKSQTAVTQNGIWEVRDLLFRKINILSDFNTFNQILHMFCNFPWFIKFLICMPVGFLSPLIESLIFVYGKFISLGECMLIEMLKKLSLLKTTWNLIIAWRFS